MNWNDGMRRYTELFDGTVSSLEVPGDAVYGDMTCVRIFRPHGNMDRFECMCRIKPGISTMGDMHMLTFTESDDGTALLDAILACFEEHDMAVNCDGTSMGLSYIHELECRSRRLKARAAEADMTVRKLKLMLYNMSFYGRNHLHLEHAVTVDMRDKKVCVTDIYAMDDISQFKCTCYDMYLQDDGTYKKSNVYMVGHMNICEEFAWDAVNAVLDEYHK